MKKMFAILAVIAILSSLSLTVMAKDSASISYDDLKWVAGDVNCDEAINAEDLVTLKKIYFEVEIQQMDKTADVNGDTYIDILDFVRLKKQLIGI